PRAAAVSTITHHTPTIPNRAAAQIASGTRSAVNVVDVSIGGSVVPDPPSADHLRRRIIREDPCKVGCDGELEYAEYHSGHHHVSDGDPAAVLRSPDFACADVLTHDRRHGSAEAEADRVKPALDAMTDPERGQRCGSEGCDAACKYYVNEGEY